MCHSNMSLHDDCVSHTAEGFSCQYGFQVVQTVGKDSTQVCSGCGDDGHGLPQVVLQFPLPKFGQLRADLPVQSM